MGAEQGMALTQIASLLGLDEEAVKRTVTNANIGEGKLLGNKYQEQLDELLQEDPELCCPVSLVLFVDPVIASDGFMYEKASLEGLLRANMASPMTRERLKKEHLPARQRRSAAIEFRDIAQKSCCDSLLELQEICRRWRPQRWTESLSTWKSSKARAWLGKRLQYGRNWGSLCQLL